MTWVPALSLVLQLGFLWLAWRSRGCAEGGIYAPVSTFFGGIALAYLLY